MNQKKYTESELLSIAKAQKGLLWCIVLNLCCIFFFYLYLLVVPLQLYLVYSLAKKLRSRAPIIWCLSMFIPVISLVMLVLLNQRAVRALTAAGYKVGLMGANLAQFRSPSDSSAVNDSLTLE